MISYTRAFDALQAHKTFFFDKDLNPVAPDKGEWFGLYEFQLASANEIADELKRIQRVQYVGKEKRLGKFAFGLDAWRVYDMFRDEESAEISMPPFKGFIAIKES